ncbi:hypothetical protein FB451DRAFT_1038912 [Mycena latifolia]|nr:hypothetical protein FB451DRAFT_1038912 [Mycena latifolia]
MSTTESSVLDTEVTPLHPLSPFDDASADTILRSSDGSDFRVYRAVLSLASPFFKDMFSIPQPESEPEVPVVPVTERSHLLDRFLRMWYPGAAPVIKFDSLDQLNEIIVLALAKYDLHFLTPILQKHLLEYLSDPVGVFAIACRYQWTELATAAAKESLKFPLSSLLDGDTAPHLKHISAHLYRSLLVYHRKCSIAAGTAGSLLPWSKAQWAWIRCTMCAPYSLAYEVPGSTVRVPPRAWIFDCVIRAQALLKETPAANIMDLKFLAPTQAKAAACTSFCRTSGPSDLAAFIVDTYAPAVAAAIDAVSIMCCVQINPHKALPGHVGTRLLTANTPPMHLLCHGCK